ncbi:MAG: bifunctional hydroxymethylpyrimidine kinase/phosphomethylpyrimidine kinase [Bacteroidota bacterium]
MKILSVHSFAVHGTASLKAMLSILGTRVLPVPSLFLTGLTNIPGHQKTEVAFETLLRGSLEIAAAQQEELILYIGYLGATQQVEVLQKAIEDFRPLFKHIIVDPVSGDHGRAYVPQEIVQLWPELLSIADWAFPNFTELKLHAGMDINAEIPPDEAIEAFKLRFPQLSFIATSLPSKHEQIELGLWDQGGWQVFSHPQMPQQYGGTGDVFASYFTLAHFFWGKSPYASMELAALQTLRCLEYTLNQGSHFLEIICPDNRESHA